MARWLLVLVGTLAMAITPGRASAESISDVLKNLPCTETDFRDGLTITSEASKYAPPFYGTTSGTSGTIICTVTKAVPGTVGIVQVTERYKIGDMDAFVLHGNGSMQLFVNSSGRSKPGDLQMADKRAGCQIVDGWVTCTAYPLATTAILMRGSFHEGKTKGVGFEALIHGANLTGNPIKDAVPAMNMTLASNVRSVMLSPADNELGDYTTVARWKCFPSACTEMMVALRPLEQSAPVELQYYVAIDGEPAARALPMTAGQINYMFSVMQLFAGRLMEPTRQPG